MVREIWSQVDLNCFFAPLSSSEGSKKSDELWVIDLFASSLLYVRVQRDRVTIIACNNAVQKNIRKNSLNSIIDKLEEKLFFARWKNTYKEGTTHQSVVPS